MSSSFERLRRTCLLLGIALGTAACVDRTIERPQQRRSPYREQILADEPVAYWRLDEQAGPVAFDQTPNANHGTIGNGVTRKYAGATTVDGDTAMFFDGRKGEIVVSDAPALEMRNGSLTLEAWVKFVGIQSGEVCIVCKGTAGVQTEYGLVLVDGVPGYQSVIERYLSKSPGLAPGVWTHLAVTITDNTRGTFYINGVEAGGFTSGSGHTVTSSKQPVVIANEGGASARFVGGIDEPAIYSRALTAVQLATHVQMAAQNSHR